MSGFKRCQSKVFWGQMATQDLGYVQRIDLELPVDEPDDSTSTNDVTAIRVCPERETETVGQATNDIQVDRCCSPLSQDLRSQDSGFSDSDRSGSIEDETPRLRTRKRSRIRQRVRGFEDLPSPAYTSTPKDRPGSSRIVRSARLVRETRPSTILSSMSLEEEGECLGDFLYASEPPEDPIGPRNIRATIHQQVQSDLSSSQRLNRRSSSIRTWLNELAVETETESNGLLVSKSLPRWRRPRMDPGMDEAKDLRRLSSLATAEANKLLIRAEQFDRHYRHVFEKVAHLEGGRSERELLRSIEEDAFSVLSELGAPPPRRIQQSSLRGTLAQLEAMKSYVDGVIDTRLDFYIERVVRGLEEAPKDERSVARGALAALTALGLSGPRAGSSIARCSGIRALLTTLITVSPGSTTDLVAGSLRALSSVCSSTLAIETFASDGGPEILADLLTTERTSQREKTEGTALIVQVTAPWTKAAGLRFLEPFADTLVPALNALAEGTSCGQTLLLVAAALNHLSRSRACARVILASDSVRLLLGSVKKSTGRNVWLMEQAASLIGELARIPEARPVLARARASVALVSFLRMRPPGLEDAYRRLEITAAAALTRLCVDPEIARQVVAVGGTDCLPAATVEDLLTEDEEELEAGLLRYTKSLRRACKRAAKQIDIAKAADSSMY